MLRHNYEIQVNTCQALREELRNKEDQFRSKMSTLETELKRFMQDSSSRAAEASNEEVQRLQGQYDLKLQRYRQELQEKESQLDKARAQNAEITRELVEATNESAASKNEARVLRDKLKKLT